MIKGVNHIGILVKDLDRAIKFYQVSFHAKLDKVEEMPERGLKLAVLSWADDGKLELLELLPDSNLAELLGRGEGFSHVALEVDNIEQECQRLSRSGMELSSIKPSRGVEGMYVFLRPESTEGVRIELLEPYAEG